MTYLAKKEFISLKEPAVNFENYQEENTYEDGKKENIDDENNLVIPPPPSPPVAGVSQSSNLHIDQQTILETTQLAPNLSRWL